MKKILLLLLAAVTISMAPASAATKVQCVPEVELQTPKVPNNLIIKQNIQMENGKQIVVYYVKDGDYCYVYSESDLSVYNVDDLLNVSKSSFEKVREYKGKCYVKRTSKQVLTLLRKMAKSL